MIYVMECGPLMGLKGTRWMVFALDEAERKVTSHVAPTREQARREMVKHLAGTRVDCCASLDSFGRPLGWRVQPVPEQVRQCAAVSLVSLEHQDVLGPLAFTPLVEALLRACALFVEVKPWQRFKPSHPLAITFSSDSTTNVLSIGGALNLPPSLSVLPDHPAFERADLEEATVLGLEDRPGLVGEAVMAAFGHSFHPRLLRLRRGLPDAMTEEELMRLVVSLTAATALGTGAAVGRAAVGDLFATIVPYRQDATLLS